LRDASIARRSGAALPHPDFQSTLLYGGARLIACVLQVHPQNRPNAPSNSLISRHPCVMPASLGAQVLPCRAALPCRLLIDNASDLLICRAHAPRDGAELTACVLQAQPEDQSNAPRISGLSRDPGAIPGSLSAQVSRVSVFPHMHVSGTDCVAGAARGSVQRATELGAEL
jgi:hypothetical protein